MENLKSVWVWILTPNPLCPPPPPLTIVPATNCTQKNKNKFCAKILKENLFHQIFWTHQSPSQQGSEDHRARQRRRGKPSARRAEPSTEDCDSSRQLCLFPKRCYKTQTTLLYQPHSPSCTFSQLYIIFHLASDAPYVVVNVFACWLLLLYD